MPSADKAIATIKAEIDRNRDRQADARRYAKQVSRRYVELHDAFWETSNRRVHAVGRMADLVREEKKLMSRLSKLRSSAA